MAFPVFLDTCVLYGATLSDFLLWLADSGTYRPLWSRGVLDELRANLREHAASEEQIEPRLDRVAVMEEEFPDALVSGYESLIPRMHCDRKDRHVLAAAVRGNAQLLVTFNLKDFPAASVDEFDLTVRHPDDFLLDQLDLYPGRTTAVAGQLLSLYQSPPLDLDGLVLQLIRAGVPRFARALGAFFE
ncbi:MAG: PIN domain-containing protein [Pseudoclavibacter sp.]